MTCTSRPSTSELLRELGTQLLTLADELDTSVVEVGPRWISLKAAARIAHRTTETVRAWAIRYGLGHKLPGGKSAPWMIDEFALRRHLARISRQDS